MIWYDLWDMTYEIWHMIYHIWYIIYDICNYHETDALFHLHEHEVLSLSPEAVSGWISCLSAYGLFGWSKVRSSEKYQPSNPITWKRWKRPSLIGIFCTCTYPNPPLFCSNSHLPPLPNHCHLTIQIQSRINNSPPPSHLLHDVHLPLGSVAADVIGSAVEEDEPLMAAGMDSLSSVEFRNRLSAEAGAGIKFPKLGWETKSSCWGEWKGAMTLNWYIYKCIIIKLETKKIYVYIYIYDMYK